MSNYVEDQFKDFLLHKQYILQSGHILIIHLLKTGRREEAIELTKRLAEHDNSKVLSDELDYIMKLECNKKSFTDANYCLTDAERKVIEKHWQHNPHHPEFHKNYSDMTELDIMEMVCDWHSRSVQYKTDLISFVKTRQENRFRFPEDMFRKILAYCEVLIEES